jgi:hypothetical protein
MFGVAQSTRLWFILANVGKATGLWLLCMCKVWLSICNVETTDVAEMLSWVIHKQGWRYPLAKLPMAI